MARRTVDELRDAYRGKVIECLDRLESDIRDYVESPIEALLVWALIGGADGPYSSYDFPSRFVLGGDGDVPCLFLIPEGHPPFAYTYVLQPAVVACGRRYRIDIALVLGEGTSTLVHVVIECDGHDFHEKTKEQAESDKRRDRDLQSIGWIVARFTGSEIVRDPDATAMSVKDLASAQLGLRRAAAANARAQDENGGR